MSIGYARDGSSIISSQGFPLVAPTEGSQIIQGELQTALLKASKTIIDTIGH